MAGFVKEKEEGPAQDVDGYRGEADDKEEFCVISEVLIERKLVTLIRANVGKRVRQTRTPVLHLGCSSSRGEEQADLGEDEQPEDLSGLVHLGGDTTVLAYWVSHQNKLHQFGSKSQTLHSGVKNPQILIRNCCVLHQMTKAT